VIRTLVRAGGIEIKGRGKGSHRSGQMPNGELLTFPYKIKPGLLSSNIRQAGMTLDEFLTYW
jgi:predicted RNA binding protein YcfA (HicA-like mRNA interferase family)